MIMISTRLRCLLIHTNNSPEMFNHVVVNLKSTWDRFVIYLVHINMCALYVNIWKRWPWIPLWIAKALYYRDIFLKLKLFPKASWQQSTYTWWLVDCYVMKQFNWPYHSDMKKSWHENFIFMHENKKIAPGLIFSPQQFSLEIGLYTISCMEFSSLKMFV